MDQCQNWGCDPRRSPNLPLAVVLRKSKAGCANRGRGKHRARQALDSLGRAPQNWASPMTSTEKVIAKAVELVAAVPEGKRYSQLVREIAFAYPDIPVNTIHGSLHKFRTDLPESVYLPTRGLYRAAKYREAGDEAKELTRKLRDERIREEDFYDAFGEWLVNELEECTRVISLGGNRFRDKWGTPDVVGIREAKRSDIIKPPTEIIAAEIKLDPAGLITAFGQACAYKLFAHKSYIVVPRSSSDEDVARLDALCRIFGIGLVLFDPTNKDAPDFSIRVRASREEPDMFYVNKYLKLVEDELFS